MKDNKTGFRVLSVPEIFQTKLSLYLGSSGSDAIFQAIKEVLDNSLDEFTEGFNSFLGLIIDKNNEITVYDEGRGIPVTNYENTDIPVIVKAFSDLHAGGKFESGIYNKATRGTFGVGAKATNALSSRFEVWTFRDKKWWYVAFKNGKLFQPLINAKPPLDRTKGTVIRFSINHKHFDEGSKLSLVKVKEYIRLQSFLCKGINIYLKTPKNEYNFCEKEGLKSLLASQIAKFGEEALGKAFIVSNYPVDLAISWTKNSGDNIVSYVSGSHTKDGGTHVNGLNDAIRDALKPYKGKYDFTPLEARDGLVGTINVSVKQPNFSSATKDKLTNIEATKDVYDIIKPALDEYFAKNKSLAKLIVQRAADLHKSFAKFTADRKSIAALKSKEAKALLSSKLARAKSKEYDKVELFLLEGDGAAGTAKQIRDKNYQAVLSLRGKVLNAYKSPTEKLFANKEIQDISLSIGFELDAKNPIEKLKVGKIILLSDPDVDGPLHPNTKILTLDGENPTIKQLAEEYNEEKPPRQVFSQNKEGNLVIGTAIKPRLAMEEKEVYRIHYDNGSIIECTTNHAWKLNNYNGNEIYYEGIYYVKTEHLRVGDLPTSVVIENKDVFWQYFPYLITKIEKIVYETPQPYYCLSVPEYGNFFVDDGKGNGILSKNSHITNLILSFFQKVFPETFLKEKVYVVDAPLFYVQFNNGTKIFASSLKEIQAKLKAKGLKEPKTGINRIKGWGECTPEILYEVAFNKKTRKLTRMIATKGRDTQKFANIVGENSSERRKLLGI